MDTVNECSLCGVLSPTLTLHISHLRLVHSKDRNFKIVCGIEECPDVFGAFSAYNSHVYRRHRVALGLEPPQTTVLPVALREENEERLEGDPIVFNDDESDTPVHSKPPRQHTPNVKAAELLLHLREGRRLSQVALTDVITTCKSVCIEVIHEFKQELREVCLQKDLDPACMEDLLSKCPPNPFHEVDSIYRLEKFCVNHFNCVVSVDIECICIFQQACKIRYLCVGCT